ncbi:MAG TPA: DNA-binding domain-containing protein [Polyangia bacterium]|nr:DNA-binding domain-containing protein [Polyangia bacterium]
MAEGPGLAELQRRFFELVTGPEGVARELAARGLPPEALAAIIAGDARASAVERLDVYANMYFFRILDVLRADYPKLVAVLGDGAFHDLATDYLQAHPSRHPSLRFVGAALPGFVAAHAAAARRPWLGELAALEWARVDVFDRADADVLGRDALAGLGPEEFADLRLVPVPACALVPAAFAVEDPWRAVEAGSSPEAPGRAGDGHAILVWRRGLVVHHRAVEGGERRALDLLLAGTTFGALCAALGEALGSDAAAAELAARCLGQWLADELLAGRLT